MTLQVHWQEEGRRKRHEQSDRDPCHKRTSSLLEKAEIAEPRAEGKAEYGSQQWRDDHGTDHCSDTIGIHSDGGNNRGQAGQHQKVT